MPGDELIVASYQTAVEGLNSFDALLAAGIALDALSLMRRVSATETLGFYKTGGSTTAWRNPDALWDRLPDAGFFFFPESGALLVTGALLTALLKVPESHPSDHSRLQVGFANLGVPEGSLQEYAGLIAVGNILVFVHSDDENSARFHDVLQTTLPATLHVHRLIIPSVLTVDRTRNESTPGPITHAIMPVNRHILFPVDFSSRSIELFPYVASVARQFHCEVTLLHTPGPYEGLPGESEFNGVDWPHYQDRLREERKNDLMRLAAGAFDGVSVTTSVEGGEAAGRIIHYAAKHEVGLIIMATHGRGKFRKLLLGSITSKVLHDSPYPVWTTAHAEVCTTPRGQDIQKVVCAFDPSSDGTRVLQATADIASVYGAEVVIVHAIPVQAANPEVDVADGFARFLAETAKNSIADLQRAAGTKWEVIIEIGPVSTAIREFALQYEADLLVIGRGHLSQRFGGLRTHVATIIRDSPCPVLSVSNDQPISVK